MADQAAPVSPPLGKSYEITHPPPTEEEARRGATTPPRWEVIARRLQVFPDGQALKYARQAAAQRILWREAVQRAKAKEKESTPPGQRLSDDEFWELLKAELPRETACCRHRHNGGRHPFIENVKVGSEGKGHSGAWAGLMRCGSVWGDPVCSDTIAVGRAAEIEKALCLAAEQKHTVIQAAFTVRHHKGDNLAALIGGIGRAFVDMRKGSGWAKIRKRFGIYGYITGWDYTFGLENGGHPHKHGVFVSTLRPDQFDQVAQQFDEMLWRRYSRSLANEGLEAEREYGLVITAGPASKAKATYISKPLDLDQEREAWQAAADLALRSGKVGREELHYSAGQLLDVAALCWNVPEEGWAKAAWLEYYYAFKGRRAIRWSSGLRKYFGIEDRTDAEIAEDLPEVVGEWAVFNQDQYKMIMAEELRGMLLDLEKQPSCTPERVRRWLIAAGLPEADADQVYRLAVYVNDQLEANGTTEARRAVMHIALQMVDQDPACMDRWFLQKGNVVKVGRLDQGGSDA